MADDGDMNVNRTQHGSVDPGQIDLINRDPNDLNSHVSVLFEDVIGEPDGAHSADVIWTWAFKCFTVGKKLCYMVLTYVCALPLALMWGCTFACIAFSHIWYITPWFKVVELNLQCAQRFFSLYINCFLAPCVEVYALMFSRIHVTIQKE